MIDQFIRWNDIGPHRFVGCKASDDFDESEEYDDPDSTSSCDDAEYPGLCDTCPHWRTTHCKKCDGIWYDWWGPCIEEPRKAYYRCRKCGEILRAWR